MRILIFAVTTAGLVLMGCEAPAGTPATTDPVGKVAQPNAGETNAQATSSQASLTSEGWGAIRVGMSRAELEVVAGALPAYDPSGGIDECEIAHPARVPEGVTVMMWKDKVSSVWIETGMIRTAEGLGMGSTASEVLAQYGARAIRRDHEYIQAPAEYLDIWTTPIVENASFQSVGYTNARGISFHIGEDGKAYLIAGGDASIKSVEGCA